MQNHQKLHFEAITACFKTTCSKVTAWSAGILLVSISIINNLVKVTEDYVMSSMKTKTSPEWR